MSGEGGDVVIGAGVTGLACGWASGLPVYEASTSPGGICASYYVRPDGEVLDGAPDDGEAYRFEIGGGHWLFGGTPEVLETLGRLAPLRRYQRRARVRLRFPDERVVSYPVQYHLHDLDGGMRQAALAELEAAAGAGGGAAEGGKGGRGRDGGVGGDGAAPTMRGWLAGAFGPTLCDTFFFPFHERYTDGLYDRIAAQDTAKTPLDIERVRAGAAGSPGSGPAAGYNQTFCYPEGGLDTLAAAMAARADVRYGRRVVAIDTARRVLHFDDGEAVPVGTVYSTLPLDRALSLAGLETASACDPSTSVVVLNVGARPGPNLGDAHWVYEPHSTSGFHRVGVYSNVDGAFVPGRARDDASRCALYVERAYRAGTLPDGDGLAAYRRAALEELCALGYIDDDGEPEVVHPSVVDVAYTWSWPGSAWRQEALGLLGAHGVVQIGRYGRWEFQGICDSVAEGLAVGAVRAPVTGRRAAGA